MAKESKQEQGAQDVLVKAAKGTGIQPTTPSRALSPFEEMDRFFDEFIPRRWLRAFRREWPQWGDLTAPFEGRMPRVDLIDRENEIVVRAEAPGVDKKDLDVSLTENTITIKGTTRHEEKEERDDYYRSEISRGSFTRTLALPADVDGSQAKATFQNGLLEVILPKVEGAKRRSIKVE